jgi:RNA polymerase sigma factor (sigma-70 family)
MSRNDNIFEDCKRKDSQAQRMLYHLYKVKFMGLCRRYAASREEAQDILQEAFIKIFMRIHQVETSDKLESWMRSVVVHTAVDGYHKQKAREVIFERIDDNDILNVKEEQSSLQQVTDEALIQCINSLPTGCRMVFNLYAVEEYSHIEIAEMLDISEGTSRSQYHHAKALLKEKLSSKKLNEYYEKFA